MKKEDWYHAISEVHPKYLDEADSYKPRKTLPWKRWCGIAACMCLFFCSTVSVLAIADNNFVYELLYALSPAIAQKLKPVSISCEDRGIKMEVVAATVEGANAAILISIQDLTEERLDETTDLFDSYSIHTPYDQTGGCSLVAYDAETKTAFFMVTIEQMNQILIPGDKITFTVSELLSRKTHTNRRLTEIDLEQVPLVNDWMENPNIRGTGGMDMDSLDENHLQLIKPNEESPLLLEEGAALTGYGMVEDKLHVQIRYSNILETDNHGDIYLKQQSGEPLHCSYSVSFWADNSQDSYEEYVFSIPSDELEKYEIWGEFWTCKSGPIQGNWQVTFPLAEP